MATYTWTGGGGNNLWSNTANWSGGIIPLATDIAVFNASATPSITAIGTLLCSINVTSGNVTLQQAGGNLDNASTAAVFTISSGASLTVDCPIGGTGAIEKAGTGTATLARANTFTGAVAVTNGTLVTVSGALAGIPSITAAAGATLTAVDANASTNVAGAGTITFSGVGISLGGLAVSGSLTFSASTGTVTVTSLGGTGTLSAASNLRVNQAFNVSRSGNTTVTGTLSKFGTFTLTLSGSNNLQQVSLQAGRITAASVNALGLSTSTFNVVSVFSGATLDLGSVARPNRVETLGGTILNGSSFTGQALVNSGGTFALTTLPNATSFVVYAGSALSLAGSAYTGTLLLLGGSVVQNGSVPAGNVTLATDTGIVTLDVTLTGAGILSAFGGTEVRLQRANTFSGGIHVAQGSTVVAFNNAAFGTGTIESQEFASTPAINVIDFNGFAVANNVTCMTTDPTSNTQLKGGDSYAGTVTLNALAIASIPSTNEMAGNLSVSATAKLAIGGQHTGDIDNSGEVEVDNSTATSTPVNGYTGNCGSTYAVRAA